MVRPAHFGVNPETVESNVFQARSPDPRTSEAAIREFDRAVETLARAGVSVTVLDDTAEPRKPDAVFPNNWFSTHEDGTLVLYPMASSSRRAERRAQDLVSRFDVQRIVDLSHWESAGRYLEGTGSLVLDRIARTAYAGLSSRTDLAVLEDIAGRLGFTAHVFPTSFRGSPVYHTNVLLSIGESFAVVGPTTVSDPASREALMRSLLETGRDVIELDAGQIASFGANILHVSLKSGGFGIVCSRSSLNCYRAEQRRALERHGNLIPLAIETIESVGGGSARCMAAEVFLSERT